MMLLSSKVVGESGLFLHHDYSVVDVIDKKDHATHTVSMTVAETTPSINTTRVLMLRLWLRLCLLMLRLRG